MPPIFTVGHGTRSLDELVTLLTGAGVGRLIDVRRFPRSRRHPHFDRASLERNLPEHDIDYDWRGDELGGRRAVDHDSRNVALTNVAFRAYADHMATEGFLRALERLEAEAADDPPLALMCAERLWWRCHRRLIADVLVARGTDVAHLIDVDNRSAHEVLPALRLEADAPVYDVGATGSLL